MNRVYGIVKTHLADRWSWLLLPWIILGISFACNLLIASSVGDEIKTGGLASIYVYMLVIGIICVGQTFPFLIGFGARRKDFFFGTAATIGLVGALIAVLVLLLGWIERSTDYWGVELHFFNVDYLTEGSAILSFWVLFTLVLNLFFMGFAISSLYRKFGRNGLYLLFISLGVGFTVAGYLIQRNDGWGKVFDLLGGLSLAELANGAFALTLVYAGISYLCLRKATV